MRQRPWGAKARRRLLFGPLGSHKAAVIRQMIQAAGARLWYLPPYSPDLNPIEQAFATIKHWMRVAQKRTIEETWRHIGHLVATIQPAECANYFENAGYASVKNALERHALSLLLPVIIRPISWFSL